MTLSTTKIQNIKAGEKTQRLFDGGGMYLEVSPSGGKWWRLKYRYGGKEKRLSLGVFPDISLKDARQKREDARKQLAAGLDPGDVRRAAKAAGVVAASNTFESVAIEWLAKQSHAPATRKKAQWLFEKHAYPWLGRRPISAIHAPELLTVLQRVESRGKLETAQRLKQQCGCVFRYAISTGRGQRDPSADLKGALATPKTKHHSSITDPALVAPLLRAIDGYSGSLVTAAALKLAPLVFVRPGELRKAEWKEIDLKAGEWRIPPEKMKMGERHIVPLSKQAMAILKELHPLTGHGLPAKPEAPCYIFPGARSKSRPMSENTVNAALRGLGYGNDVMTGHGFRSMASTLLHEQGWRHEVIERQLAHSERNKVSAAYNYAKHLPERRKMMQAWADYLDVLRNGRKVIVGRFGGQFADGKVSAKKT